MSEPEEIFTSALEVLYNEVPVTVATTHGVYTHGVWEYHSYTVRVICCFTFRTAGAKNCDDSCTQDAGCELGSTGGWGVASFCVPGRPLA